ncbi:MAG: hypothetical protein ACRDZ4_02715 [Egibacteraceae bacterium]
MSRIHDLGGMEGFGLVDPTDDGLPFSADWEARVVALVVALSRRGIYELDEVRDAIERLEPSTYLELSYYERWFAAICRLLVEKGVLSEAELEPHT